MSDPGASHLPVLQHIGRTISVKRVVEYGCGLYSTLEFLRVETFPVLEQLISYEDDVTWARRIALATPDLRLTLLPVEPGMFCMQEIPVGFDLAFVDSSTADSRVAMLPRLRGRVQFVVLHDYDGPQAYRDACELWPYRLVHRGGKPQTAIMSMEPFPAELVAGWGQI